MFDERFKFNFLVLLLLIFTLIITFQTIHENELIGLKNYKGVNHKKCLKSPFQSLIIKKED